jgi:fimbrial chaperone protein
MRTQRRVRGGVLVALGLWIGVAGVSSAARFSLNLTRIHLGRAHPVETVVFGNEEPEALSFEVHVQRWTQKPDGTWELVPSNDLIVHPLIMSVAAGEKARLRIGTLAPGVTAEQAYRVVLQQLPDPNAPRDAMQIRMLTRISLPVFLEPDRATPAESLSVTSADRSGATLLVRNSGTAYAPAGDATVRVLDASGRLVHEGRVTLGYVLAGAQLPMTVSWPAGVCGRAAQLELVASPEIPLRAAVAPVRRCAP